MLNGEGYALVGHVINVALTHCHHACVCHSLGCNHPVSLGDWNFVGSESHIQKLPSNRRDLHRIDCQPAELKDFSYDSLKDTMIP